MSRNLLPLTEPMLYVLMALYNKARFGKEVVEFIFEITDGELKLGPGTLYTILARFEDSKLIREIGVDGRKRTYELTGAGIKTFEAEIDRLQRVLNNARTVQEKPYENKI